MRQWLLWCRFLGRHAGRLSKSGALPGVGEALKPKHVWAIRVRLELAENYRHLALFNLAIDSKLRGCDLVKMKVIDVMASGQIKERASVLQSKTQKPSASKSLKARGRRWHGGCESR